MRSRGGALPRPIGGRTPCCRGGRPCPPDAIGTVEVRRGGALPLPPFIAEGCVDGRRAGCTPKVFVPLRSTAPHPAAVQRNHSRLPNNDRKPRKCRFTGGRTESSAPTKKMRLFTVNRRMTHPLRSPHGGVRSPRPTPRLPHPFPLTAIFDSRQCLRAGRCGLAYSREVCRVCVPFTRGWHRPLRNVRRACCAHKKRSPLGFFFHASAGSSRNSMVTHHRPARPTSA